MAAGWAPAKKDDVLGQDGRDGLAGTAPGREAVDEDLVVLGDGGLELGETVTR
jgi:hypothetical protein